MKVLITLRQPLKVVGMQIRTTVQENAIQELWTQFIARMAELDEIAVPECSLGICSFAEDNENEDSFDYLAARVVKNDQLIPEGMTFLQLPEQQVAVFTHRGSLDNLSGTYDYIYNKWLPESDYDLADAPEIEWYDSRFIFDSQDSQMDIHIPIKPKDLEEEIVSNIL